MDTPVSLPEFGSQLRANLQNGMHRVMNNTSQRLNSNFENRYQIPSELNINIFSSREIYSRGKGEMLLPETPVTENLTNYNQKT